MVETGLKGKVVLVTGAQHGIGAATAKALAAQGAAVFLHYFRLPSAPGISATTHSRNMTAPGKALYRARQAMSANEVVRDIHEAGGKVEAWEADLADPKTPATLLDRAEAAFGPVQVLVNNAAHWEPDSFLPPGKEASIDFLALWTKDRACTLRTESYEQHFAVNVRATALLMAEFVRRLTERDLRWGRIINVSTDAADCFPGEVSYGASKAALEAYSRSAAWELGKFGITVNIVAPGPTQTGWITRALEEKILPSIPLGRLGQPEDVADVIVFLASEQARWVTGQLLYVGGGHRM